MPRDPEPGRLPETGTPSPLSLFSERLFKVLEEAGWLLLIFILLTALLTPILMLPGVLAAFDANSATILVDPELASRISPYGMKILRTASLATIFTFALTFVGYVGVRERHRLRDWMKPSVRSIGFGLAGGVALFAVGFGYEYLLQLLGIAVPDVAAGLVKSVPFALLFLAVAIIAPLGEEMYFRGRLFEGLERWYGEAAATSVSAGLFAFAHMIAPLLPIYFLFGLVFVALRKKTGGLLAPVLAHFTNNAVGLALAWMFGLSSS